MRSAMSVVVMVALLLAPCAAAADSAQALEVKPGTVSVSVKTHDGKALPNAEVRVLNADDEATQTVVADENGECGIEELEAGSYKLVVADRAMLPFTVSDKAKVDTLLVVLPPPVEYAAGDVEKTVTVPVLVTFIVGTIAVGVGGYALLHDGGSTHGDKVHE